MANPAPGYQKKPEHRVDLLSETRRVRVTFDTGSRSVVVRVSRWPKRLAVSSESVELIKIATCVRDGSCLSVDLGSFERPPRLHLSLRYRHSAATEAVARQLNSALDHWRSLLLPPV